MKVLFLVAALIIVFSHAQDSVPSFLLGTWEKSSTTCTNANATCIQSIGFSVTNSAFEATYTNTSSCGGGSSTMLINPDVEVDDMTVPASTTLDITEGITLSTNSAGVMSLTFDENGCQAILTKTAGIMKVATAIVAVIAAAFMLI